MPTNKRNNKPVEAQEERQEATANIRAPKKVGVTEGEEGRLRNLHHQGLRDNLDSGNIGRTSGGRRDDLDDEAAEDEGYRRAS